IYSPLYKPELLARYGMPPGKVDSNERALHHSGDDLKGDQDGDDGLDNEIITVDLSRINPNVNQIFFFLNNCGKEDFSQIPYASIRMYEGTPTRVKEVFASYDVAAESQYKNMTALIMGKLYRRNGEWKFSAIGDAYPDVNLCETIRRIVTNYAK
ncbi:MAG: TerD family protein, partial [Muribaculaceae bacterium]|nr:TerD family protein [Muribaculaceae bacterium]